MAVWDGVPKKYRTIVAENLNFDAFRNKLPKSVNHRQLSCIKFENKVNKSYYNVNEYINDKNMFPLI